MQEFEDLVTKTIGPSNLQERDWRKIMGLASG